MDPLNAARLSSLKKSNTEKPETSNMSTLFAARQGALPREGNEAFLKEAASKYEPGTPQRTAFAEARRNTEYGKRFGRLGGKSRRRNKKGKKKTSKRRHRN